MKSRLRDEIQAAASAHPPRMCLQLYPPILERGIVFTLDYKMGKTPASPLAYEAYPPAVKRAARAYRALGLPITWGVQGGV